MLSQAQGTAAVIHRGRLKSRAPRLPPPLLGPPSTIQLGNLAMIIVWNREPGAAGCSDGESRRRTRSRRVRCGDRTSPAQAARRRRTTRLG
eukprot:766634-Hanusia_phi.AAC.4